METNLNTPQNTKKTNSKHIIFILAAGLVLMTYLYVSNERQLRLIKDPKAQAEYVEKIKKDSVEELKKYVVIAEGDEPVLISVVSDAQTLRSQQAFFANIENGDQIFVFEKTYRALIWRPSSRVVVNFGSLDVQPQKGEAPQVKTPDTKSTKTASTTPKK